MPTLEINGQPLAYTDSGTGFPVLLVHNYLWNGDQWAAQVAALSPKYRCIVPDLWGHGQSGPLPSQPYTLEALAADHLALLDHLGIERCAVVGLSVGAMGAAHLALAQPQRVAGLVLMDTSLAAETPEDRQLYQGMAAMVSQFKRIPRPLAAQVLTMMLAEDTRQQRPDLVTACEDRWQSWPKEHISSLVALSKAVFKRQSVMEQLATLPMPTLVLVGSEDTARPPTDAQALAAAIPQAQYLEIAAAGHTPPVEQPEAVNQALVEFLAALS